jgi:phage virion morphogenesis protein
MVEVEIDDEEIRRALQHLLEVSGNLRPALQEIGERLTESTKHRFETITGPDGRRWPLNSVLSTLLYKDGDRPLTGETGALMDTIHWQLVGDDAVEIGSPMEYAAMQQFGGTKAEFPHLWGDIPARPFLGISDDDKDAILDEIQAHIEAAL